VSWRDLLGQAWTAVAGQHRPPAQIEVTGKKGLLASPLPVEDTALACAGAALQAAATLRKSTTITLDRNHVAAAFRSEQYVSGSAGFAPLSRFWRTADGWVRTHGNYPWHRDALLRALAASEDTIEQVIAERTAAEVEQVVTAAGGVAAAVRAEAAWSATAAPLIGGGRIGDAPPREAVTNIRVLDLTRVIAGPVATRYLAALGADVLRIDPPHRPELPLHQLDGLVGKRSAIADFSSAGGLALLHELLDGADVLVHGYRPGALDRFGLAPAALAERHPGLVVIALSAWGEAGGRGFDSIVQAATGIAVACSPDGDRPGALPCQLLDHGTGYLCAAAALWSLAARAADGGTWYRSLCLSRTARWLLSHPHDEAATPTLPAALEPDGPWLGTVPGPGGQVPAVNPVGSLDGVPLRWPGGVPSYGATVPAWDGPAWDGPAWRA
jgi:CoA-transferase family III